MFKTKKSSLIERKMTSAAATASKGNAFTNAGKIKGNSFVNNAKKRAAMTTSGNGALKFSTTGNDFVDQFGKAGAYKEPRTFEDISKDMSTLWAQSSELTVKFLLYLRLITRTVQFSDGSKTSTVQRGQGLRHEGIFRMMWLAINHPKVFWANFHLFIAVGSWKDVITMLQYDLVYNGWEGRVLDWNKFGTYLLAGLENDNTTNLIKKYLPQIRSNSVTKTVEAQADNIIAKWVASLLFGGKISDNSGATYKRYRVLKTSGKAHEWQKLISKGNVLSINFDTIHGRALAQLVSGKFLKNNNLETRYQEWIASKPVAKYTGYVYELLATIPNANQKYQVDTIVKQFNQLVETAKKGAKTNTSLIVVRDTSGSMSYPANGTKIASGDVAKSLALFFAEMLPDGYFANSWIEFNSTAQMHEWKGSTVVEKWRNDRASYVGNTNFQSVITLFAKIKTKDNVPESEFPTGILCISDGEFDPSQLGKTNVESARDKLRAAGFSKEYVDNFQIILWNIPNGYYGRDSGQKFETYNDVKNVFYFSGLDGSIVSTITGQTKDGKMPSTASEVFDAAMDQEVLNLVTV